MGEIAVALALIKKEPIPVTVHQSRIPVALPLWQFSMALKRQLGIDRRTDPGNGFTEGMRRDATVLSVRCARAQVASVAFDYLVDAESRQWPLLAGHE